MSKYRKMAALNPFAFLRRSAAPVAALLACTALQASAEIVYHEDFEGDPAKWPISVIYRGVEPGKWIHVPSKEAAFGRRALYLEASDEAQWMFLLADIPAERLHGRKIRLTAWCKSDFPVKAEIGLAKGHTYSAGPGKVGIKTTEGNGWERIVVEGERAPGEMVSLAAGIGYGATGASMLIDEVTLECADELPPLPELKAPGTNFVEMRRMWSQRRRFDALADSYRRDAALGLPVDGELLKRLVTAQENYRKESLTPADAAVIAACRQYALEARLINPSVEFDVDTPVSAKTEPEVDVTMPVNGYEAKILLVRNHSGRTQYFRPRWEAKNAPAPQLRRMIPVEGCFDAMPPLPFDSVFEVADGETKGIWIDLRSRDLKPGIYRGTLVFTPLDPAAVTELRVPVRQAVAAIESPKELPVAVFNWDYGVTKDQADYEFLRKARVNVFHVNGGNDAKEAVNWEKSNLKQVLDQVDANGDRGKVIFFLENWFTGAADKWNGDLDNYYLQLAAYMKSRGYDYDQWIVHCFDETLGDKFLNGAKNIKRLDSRIRIFSDPPPANADQLRPFLPYLDYFCLGSWFRQEDAKNGNQALELLRSTGKPLWIYECESQPRHPLDNYRRMALNSLQCKWDGFTFWSLTGLEFRHASITPPAGVINYGMTYLDENAVRYPSRRWALWELGVDDYALVTALREKGIDVDGEIRAMYGTKGAVALDDAMEAFKKEKLKAFVPVEK
ncbi:hypothetical protein [uncultured Victivallis sp.]|uniref:hypothetical protein n=1 Tax=uncultured Victivallis sp. TaxID=354118 RepID=UPI002590F132|nr:hypothetical protein [uncultured Victivallis sp.]